MLCASLSRRSLGEGGSVSSVSVRGKPRSHASCHVFRLRRHWTLVSDHWQLPALPGHVVRALRFVCYPPYCFCNFPFPRMGCSLVGGKGKSCRREILCYGIKGWIRQPVDENRGSIISIRVLIFARSWTSWRDASATVLCQKTVQLSRQRDAESAKWVMTSHF